MRFFTTAWHSGEMPDDEAAGVSAAYKTHIQSLIPPLPADALRLVDTVSLHDGLVRDVAFTHEAVEIIIRAGDIQTGYFDARLRYGGGVVPQTDRVFLARAAREPTMELLYDEFDSADGAWIHYMLFWPYREVAIRFATLDLSITPTPHRFDAGAA